MNTKGILILALLGGTFAPPVCSVAENILLPEGGVPSKANSNEESLYADATRAINEGRWADADTLFTKVVQQHGSRAEGALYWKAYAQNKEGKAPDALETCTQLRRAYPKSQWLEECRALEIEIRGQSGRPVPPQSEPNDELKLLALNSLMQQDEARALPIVRQILSGNGSERLKERALFVLTQSNSKQAQEILGEITQGHSNPELQIKAIQMFAVMKGKQSAETLANIYRNSSNEQVKKAILQAYSVSGNSDRLLDIARHESNMQLARQAISGLGVAGNITDLATLYRESNRNEVKAAVLQAFIPAGSKGQDALRNIALSERDPSLQRQAIRTLGISGGAAMAPTLVEIYQKSSSHEIKKAALQGLFLAGDAHDLVALARAEKDPAMKQEIVQHLSIMNNKEASSYMLEILEK